MIISDEIFTHCPDTASNSQITSSIPLSGVPHVEPKSSSINYALLPVISASRGMEFIKKLFCVLYVSIIMCR